MISKKYIISVPNATPEEVISIRDALNDNERGIISRSNPLYLFELDGNNVYEIINTRAISDDSKKLEKALAKLIAANIKFE